LTVKAAQPLNGSVSIAVPPGSAVGTMSVVDSFSTSAGMTNGQGTFLANNLNISAGDSVAFILTFTQIRPNFYSAPIAMTIQNVRGSLPPVPVSAVLRPLNIPTKAYADAWKSATNVAEAKSAPLDTPSSMSQTLNESIGGILTKMNIHTVQTIKFETIAAAVLLGQDISSAPVLVHVRGGETLSSLQVRSKEKSLSDAVILRFKSLFV